MRKKSLLLVTITIALTAVTSSIVISEDWGKTERIAHLHGKINLYKPEVQTIDINLGNLSCGEWFQTENYSVNLPVYQTENITIWLGDKGWCSFGVFEHFYLDGYIINSKRLKENISVDLAHDNLHICNCQPGTLMVFRVKGQVGYPRMAEFEPLSLDGLHLVMHLEN